MCICESKESREILASLSWANGKTVIPSTDIESISIRTD